MGPGVKTKIVSATLMHCCEGLGGSPRIHAGELGFQAERIIVEFISPGFSRGIISLHRRFHLFRRVGQLFGKINQLS